MEKLAIPMALIEAYSYKHILIILCIAASVVMLTALLLCLRADKKYVIFLTGVILLLFEVMKQFLLTYVRGGHYSWSDFPFQLCSTPMYLCLLYPFFKKHRQTVEDFLMVYGIIGAVAAFSIPYSSFYRYLLLTVQSLAWHGLLLFLGIYLWYSGKRNCTGRRFLSVGILYILLAVIAVILNISFYEVSAGDSNMFFLGPGYPQITILDMIYEKFGWVVETITMIAASTFAGFILFRILTFHKEK